MLSFLIVNIMSLQAGCRQSHEPLHQAQVKKIISHREHNEVACDNDRKSGDSDVIRSTSRRKSFVHRRTPSNINSDEWKQRRSSIGSNGGDDIQRNLEYRESDLP